jgi:hypothetical protein
VSSWKIISIALIVLGAVFLWQHEWLIWKLEGGRTFSDSEARHIVCTLYQTHLGSTVGVLATPCPFTVKHAQKDGDEGTDEWIQLSTRPEDLNAFKNAILKTIPSSDSNIKWLLIQRLDATKAIPPSDRPPRWWSLGDLSYIDIYEIKQVEINGGRVIGGVWISFNSKTGSIHINRWSI